ncbi:MAG: hypothetical protein DRH12_16270 [Deltaproteobacteria bacterium]|nr:MAG: hypothetical protein DRH12_16270 [Deltaproteobacteria bacterium]
MIKRALTPKLRQAAKQFPIAPLTASGSLAKQPWSRPPSKDERADKILEWPREQRDVGHNLPKMDVAHSRY